MALSFRLPVSDVLNGFTSEEQSIISRTAVKKISEFESHNYEIANFSMPDFAKSKLSQAGIYLSPYASMPHSHPISKTIENHILYRVLPNYVDNSFYFVGIKEGKLNFLKRRNKDLSLVSLVNRLVTSRDCVRYPSDFHAIKTHKIEGLVPRTSNFFEHADSLKDLIPKMIREGSKKMFFHDELHYWSKRDLVTFLDAVDPSLLICTIVYPTEILVKSRVSLNSWCYTFELIGKDILYSPDGVASESYLQPISGGFLLKTNQIETPNGSVYAVDLLYNCFSHSLISLTKTNKLPPKLNFFSNYEAISTTSINSLGPKLGDCYPISFDLISKIYLYLRTLKKPDLQSGMAKLRQMVSNPSCFEIKFVEDFCRLVIEVPPQKSLLIPDASKIFLHSLMSIFPSSWVRNFNSFQEITLDNFISSLAPLRVRVELKKLDFSDDLFSDLGLSHEEEFPSIPFDPEQLMESFSIGRSKKAIPDRVPSPYNNLIFHGAEPIVDTRDKSVLIQMYHCVFNAFSNSDGFYVSSRTFFSVADGLYARNSIFSNKALRLAFISMCSGRLVKDVYLLNIRRKIFFVRSPTSGAQIRTANLQWFFLKKRGNQKFLRDSAFSDESNLETKVFTSWMKVVDEVLLINSSSSLGMRSTLRDSGLRNLWEYNCSTTSYPAPSATESVEKVEEIEEESVATHENVPILKRDVSSFLKIAFNVPTVQEEVVEVKDVVETLGTEEEFEAPALEKFGDAGIVFGRVKDMTLVGCLDMVFNENLHDVLHLKGRSAVYFTRCPCLRYGHNGLQYLPQKWPIEFDWFLGENLGKYNSCLVQRFEVGAKIGFHSDDEKHYSSDNDIYTVNLMGNAQLSIRPKGDKRKANEITRALVSQDSYLMPSGFQDKFEHSIRSMTEGRVSYTFRKVVHDSLGQEIVHDSICLLDCFSENLFDVKISASQDLDFKNFQTFPVPADGDCFWHSVGYLFGTNGIDMRKTCSDAMYDLGVDSNGSLVLQMIGFNWAEREAVALFARVMGVEVTVFYIEEGVNWTFTPLEIDSSKKCYLVCKGNHFEPCLPKNGCVVRAVAACIGKKEIDVLSYLGRGEFTDIYNQIMSGNGLSILDFERAFSMFGIKAFLETDGKVLEINSNGSIEGSFRLTDDHLEFLPFKSVKHLSSLPVSNLIPVAKDQLEVISKCCTEVEYTPSFDRANTLSESLLNGTTGVLCSRNLNNQVDFLEGNEKLCKEKRNLMILLGTFGSGKSFFFKKFIKDNSMRKVIFVSPRKALADIILQEISGIKGKKNWGSAKGNKVKCKKGYEVLTFEVMLKRIRSSFLKGTVVIVDEVQLYPPGYVDLLCMLISSDCKVFLTGDPCQSDYDSDKDRMIFYGMEPDIMHILNEKSYNFNVESRRFVGSIFRGRLPCEFLNGTACFNPKNYEMMGHIKSIDKNLIKSVDVILVSGFEEKRICWSHLGAGNKCLTFGESTGLTFESGIILITSDSFLCGKKRWITALPRFRKLLVFSNLTNLSYEDIAQKAFGEPLYKFLTEKASTDDLLEILPGKPNFVKGFGFVGKSEGEKEVKLQGDPWLKEKIFLGQSEDIQEEIQIYEEIKNEWFKTHVPLSEQESCRIQWLNRLLSREAREKRMGSEISTQFAEEHHPGQGSALSNAAERYEAIYPRHKGGDSVTFLMAVAKRLTFSRPAVESAKLRRAENFGKMMLDKFLKHVPLRRAHNQNMMAEAVAEFEEKKCSKSAATIENHSARSCNDWLLDIANIFMKSQLCSKFDNRCIDKAKAGQTLACFQHSVLCRFAPYVRYIEKKLFEVLPKNLYIHSGKSLEELEKWVMNGSFNSVCTESDYEAFDASQDHFIVAFELELMRYLGLPNDLIEDYRMIKVKLSSKLGNFAIMRFTGEASTFLFNTMANMLFTFMKYDLSGKEFICFAGDDMCANKRLRLSSEYDGFLSKLKLKAKVQFTKSPTFCGWCLSEFGLFKRPQLVWERICIAVERGNIAECLDSYAIEVSYGYKVGESLAGKMSSVELDSHYQCVRFIVKHQNLLKSNIKDLFAS
ncbi:replication-associated polyprotein [Rubus canadensis virus 1]|uniref:Replication-associated polyprotein n=1 Tax=Rubus canadensis virus 1 TaxID=1243178 RepID=K4MTI1_9VIRU|nr:replication-associated polyprotein [Rubus canadensis virus 1]AFV31417.1 replication-associated polyprotein [Rubus canadensis virus 1]